MEVTSEGFEYQSSNKMIKFLKIQKSYLMTNLKIITIVFLTFSISFQSSYGKDVLKAKKELFGTRE